MTFSIKLLLGALLATGCYATAGYDGDVYGYNEYGDPIYYYDGSYMVRSDGYWYSQGPYGYVPYGHHHAYSHAYNRSYHQHHYDDRHQAYRQHNDYRQHHDYRHNEGHYNHNYQHHTQDHRGYRR